MPLTVEDFELLGERPSFQSIAARLLRKIQAIQSKGPYRIGGRCLGGILAYEIASQMRSAGEKVPLVVLLDAPNPACFDWCDSLDRKLSYLRYVVERATRLGPRRTFVYACEHAFERFERIVGTGKRSAHHLTQAVAYAYQPPKYDGDVLLLLAAERPPYVNLVPGWQSVVTGELYIHHVNAHSRDLLKAENVQEVADAIVSHLSPDYKPLSCCAGQANSCKQHARWGIGLDRQTASDIDAISVQESDYI